MGLSGLFTEPTNNVVLNQLPTNFINNTTLYGYLLPWIFTFAIVYGLLVKAAPFGASVNKQVSVALSFVIAFFVTGVAGPQMAAFFTSFFGGASVFLAGILVIIIFATMVGGESKIQGKTVSVVIVVIIGILLFISSSGYFLGGRIYLDSQTASIIFWLAIVIIAAWLITKEGGGGTPPAGTKKPGE